MEIENFSQPLGWLSENMEENSEKLPSFWLRISVYSCYHPAREQVWEKLKSFPPGEIAADLERLVVIASDSKIAQEKVKELINNLPVDVLGKKIDEVLFQIAEKEKFEVEAAVLRALPAQVLIPYFSTIQKLSQSEGLSDMRSLMRELLAKIIGLWSLEEKRLNLRALIDYKQSYDRVLADAAHLAYLEIMAAAPISELRGSLDYLMELSSYPNSEISVLASELALSFLSSPEYSYQGLRETCLKYCQKFNDWGNKKIRCGFRHLALETIYNSTWIKPEKHADFLISCLDSHRHDERFTSLLLLRKIDGDKLPLEKLLQSQCSGLRRVRFHTRRLAHKISGEKLAENLKLLLDLQKSCNRRPRELALNLLLKIPRKKLLEQKDLLNRYRDSGDMQVGLLVRMVTGFN